MPMAGCADAWQQVRRVTVPRPTVRMSRCVSVLNRFPYPLSTGTQGEAGRTSFLGQAGSRRLRAHHPPYLYVLALFRYQRIERQLRLQTVQGKTLTFLTVARKRCDYGITSGVVSKQQVYVLVQISRSIT